MEVEGMTINGQIEESKLHMIDFLDLSEDVLNYSQDEEAPFYHQSEVNLWTRTIFLSDPSPIVVYPGHSLTDWLTDSCLVDLMI